MKNSHLILTLGTFTKKELSKIKKWLDSPVHNQREDVVLLFEYLTTNARLADEKYLKKEKIFRKIFPREPYDDARLRQTMHFLLKAIEEYLVWQELTANPVKTQIALATVYRKRNLPKAFHKSVRQVETQQKKFPFRNEEYLENEFLLEQERYLFLEGKKRTIKMNLQEVSDMLDLKYIVDRLRQSNLMLAHQRIYKASYNLGLQEEIMQYVEEKNLLEVPAVGIYYYVYKTIVDQQNPTHFEALTELIRSYSDIFPQEQMRDFYLHAINYCIRRLNAGEESYFREAFELYRQGIEEKILFINNTIDPYLFRNVTSAGLKLKELKWVDDFIHNYKDYLDKQHRENFFKYNLARLRLEQRDYNAAMELLAQTDFDDVLVQMNAKTLLLKIYYELDEFNALESLLESMRTYLNRKELVGSYRLNYQNIIRYTKKLVRLNPYDKEKREKLRKELSTVNPLAERSWLLAQLDNM